MSVAKTSEHERAALLYRSLANPRPQRPKKALLDAIRARNNSTSTEKGLFRETMAYYALEQFSLCTERLQQALALNPGNKDTEKELERTTRKYMQCKLFHDQQNRHRSCIGDMLIVRAGGDLGAGTELVFSYVLLEETLRYKET
ncbi:hypothetical protein QIS74_12590 [Colletotrichum tabaci]|uniref:Uncharacterized protein n=1 Tax=Colletotrichum tabaci TaxID=1209068 RepID=A0AAV9SWE9_9PEZI